MNKRRTEGFSKGDELHEIMVDCVQMYFEMIIFKGEDIKLESDYHDGEYIYDLYIPRYDIPIEIGSNRESKLDYLLKNKRMFCLVLLERRVSCHFDWLARGRGDPKTQKIIKPIPRVMVHNYKSLKMIFVTRHKIPGFKTLNERIYLKGD